MRGSLKYHPNYMKVMLVDMVSMLKKLQSFSWLMDSYLLSDLTSREMESIS